MSNEHWSRDKAIMWRILINSVRAGMGMGPLPPNKKLTATGEFINGRLVIKQKKGGDDEGAEMEP